MAHPTLREKGACPYLGALDNNTLNSTGFTRDELIAASQRGGITKGLATILVSVAFRNHGSGTMSLFQLAGKNPPQHRGSVAHDDNTTGEITPTLEQKFKEHAASNGTFTKEQLVAAFVTRHREDRVSFRDSILGHAEAQLMWHALSEHLDGGELSENIATDFLFRYRLPSNYITPGQPMSTWTLLRLTLGNKLLPRCCCLGRGNKVFSF